MNILLTGGAGYIGSHTALVLLDNGHKVSIIDSLINGNVKELRAFALALTAKNTKMRWTGYARCDGRMDDDYFKDIAEGGCIMLNFGCESGSQKVLDDMAKGVTIKEMEDQLTKKKRRI